MKNPNCGDKVNCTQEYTATHVLTDNVPYIIMVLTGASILLLTLGIWYAAGLILYGIIGAVWFMIFICPYCHYYGTKSCPCGYGMVSARFMGKKDGSLFRKKFRKHVPIIFPLWLIPVLAGIYGLITSFSYLMAGLIALFIVDAFVVLPWFSREYGCKNCPNRQDCPWMKPAR